MRGGLSRGLVLIAGIVALALLPGCPDGGDADGGGGGGGDTTTDTGPDGGGEPCVPACDWRECGPDPACGSSCGACTGGEVCDKGSCIPPGCTPDCAPVECGRDPVCGSYCGDCPGGETCQAGVCVEGTCTPQCGRRECGPDPGCFTSCGTCPGGEHCEDGTCVPGECQPLCGERECGPDPRCGLSCGTCEAGTCQAGQCVSAPDCCANVECGPSPVAGCEGQSCGTCEANETCLEGVCVCQPQCGGRECGPDGCGGVCGTCEPDCVCGAQGTCSCGEEPCCDGRECGPDPCLGTSCGNCPEGEQCTDTGQCIPTGCEPVCGERVCGPDPVCGDSCGTCEAGCLCSADGRCLCENLGACANEHDLPILNEADEVALVQTCVLNSECPQPTCYGDCFEQELGISADCADCYGELAACGLQRCIQRCLADQGGGDCLACLDQFCMTAFEACAGIELLPCEPECGERQCGPDPVCGVSCGACPQNEHCEDGVCVPGACVPQCGQRECGPDPVCGRSCGVCPDGERCNAGFCEPLLPPPEDACNNAADLAILNEADPAAVAQTCLVNGGCSFSDAACISRCIAQETGLSAACARCFGETSVCALENCLNVCLADPGGAGCLDCLDLHCLEDFEACSGVTWGGGECVPQCGQRECGPDPVCGVSCGTCPDGERCAGGFCEPLLPPPDDACANAADLAILNTVDAQQVAQTCVLAAGCGTDEACITACIAAETGISDACAACYGGLASCGMAFCLLDCYQDPGGPACLGCLDANCMAEFEACSGITWADEDCTPQCTDRDCGPDGCGGTCGTCADGETCSAGQCVALPQDACDNASDLALLPNLDFEGLVTTCLLSCWTDQECLTGCVQQETGLSAGCSACVGAAGVCVAELCLNDCLQDPTGMACLLCAANNCGPGFETCSGVPLPVLPL